MPRVDPEQAERERRSARGRPPRNTPAVMRVRLVALEKWNAELDKRLDTLEASSRGVAARGEAQR